MFVLAALLILAGPAAVASSGTRTAPRPEVSTAAAWHGPAHANAGAHDVGAGVHVTGAEVRVAERGGAEAAYERAWRMTLVSTPDQPVSQTQAVVALISGTASGTAFAIGGRAGDARVEGRFYDRSHVVHTYYVLAGQTPVLVHNTSCPIGGAQSIGGRLRAAGPGEEFGLPNQGRIRYVPRGYNPAEPLPRGPQNGFLDRFGNEWTVGPSRTPGEPFEWDVQLSRRGREQIGWLSRDGSHVNVSPRGRVTH